MIKNSNKSINFYTWYISVFSGVSVIGSMTSMSFERMSETVSFLLLGIKQANGFHYRNFYDIIVELMHYNQRKIY